MKTSFLHAIWCTTCNKFNFTIKISRIEIKSSILATGPTCPMWAFNRTMQLWHVRVCVCVVCVSAPSRLAVYWVSNTELTSCQGFNVWSASRTMWPAFREKERGWDRGGRWCWSLWGACPPIITFSPQCCHFDGVQVSLYVRHVTDLSVLWFYFFFVCL